jgi:hypothetical protein
MTMNRQTMICAVLTAGLLSGCATTKMMGEWRNPDAEKAGPYKKILVTAITSQETVRRPFEDAFGSALARFGAAGVSGYTLLPATGEADKDQLVKAVRDAGADAALVVRLVSKDTRSHTSVISSDSRAYWNSAGYYGSYHSGWTGYYEPISVYEYETEYDIITVEAKLFDATTEKLVWAASTETVDPRKLQQEIAAYAKLICKRLGKNGLLSP